MIESNKCIYWSLRDFYIHPRVKYWKMLYFWLYHSYNANFTWKWKKKKSKLIKLNVLVKILGYQPFFETAVPYKLCKKKGCLVEEHHVWNLTYPWWWSKERIPLYFEQMDLTLSQLCRLFDNYRTTPWCISTKCWCDILIVHVGFCLKAKAKCNITAWGEKSPQWWGLPQKWSRMPWSKHLSN